MFVGESVLGVNTVVGRDGSVDEISKMAAVLPIGKQAIGA